MTYDNGLPGIVRIESPDGEVFIKEDNVKEVITKIKDRLNGSEGLDMLEEELGLD